MKEKNKQIKNLFIKYLPFIVYTILIVILHLKMSVTGDDKYFITVLKDTSLFDWLTNRYNTWSSRVILEGIMVTLLYFGHNVWKIFNIAVFLILPYALKKLFNDKNDIKFNWLICISTFLIPASCYGDAGWVATSMNYMWPLAFGVLACVPIKKNLNNQNLTVLEKIITIISIIIASNQEQMAGILTIIYTITIIYNLIKKKNNMWIIVFEILILLSLSFILTCPGNSVRQISEIQTWFPAYDTLNLIDKVQLAITSMMRYITLKGRIVFIATTMIIMIAVFLTNKTKLFRIISLIPFIGSMPLNFLNKIIPDSLWVVKDAIIRFNAYEVVINASTYNNILLYIIFAYYIVILGSVIISLYAIFKNISKSIIPILIFGLGIISRMVMGFSPTVFASAERPTIFLYASFIGLILYIWKYLKDIGKDNRFIEYIIIIISLISYGKNFFSIF